MTCVVIEFEVVDPFESIVVHIWGPYEDAHEADLFAKKRTRADDGHDYVAEVRPLEEPI